MDNAAVRTATLGMGCFWSPEALFGHLPGVIRTAVGYAGGTTPDPTYREMGDHSETVQLQYDSNQLAFQQLVELFWQSHNPININGYKGTQYMSLLFYNCEEQEEVIRHVIQNRINLGYEQPETRITRYTEFYPAEERHQKYYLQRYPDAIEKLSALYPDKQELFRSTLAARLNGLAKGYTSMERIRSELEDWNIGPDERKELLELLRRIKW
ncbi:peptide-methionine (S)-S-oxide reductase MsrA [Paenibacillus radicis (ex Gao et al. 2016)]|uniref:Peptide methionine sulfoxide reductase MsrA n=1 Tax=Paenibacillus radicis (ex Gao et al. 2016) TaxID=1737354 RepID=A0A917H466_9BACL|nr:peptide-methionine (S)-S-oxide reductase MsrA [Paenibacillus radicis (ex Gao et al. 2016)]GGG66928.1 methionine-S-sulfoxide reductase [Paenibacillus radicis (ex Gao et al. 2016)]